MSTARKSSRLAIALVCALAWASAPAQAAAGSDEEAELAKKLANPVASLTSVPFQYNYDEHIGPNDDGSRSALNVQPVLPFSLDDDWNLIVRTIVPLIDQNDVSANGQGESGVGDILQSFFFSPKELLGGWVLAAGPVGLYPSATGKALGGEKWGGGPTALALKQTGAWTIGLLTNHVWSFAGDKDRADISATFMQPFITYITQTKTTFSLNSESTYDWKSEQWAVPINMSVAQMFKAGPQILQVQLGARYWVNSTRFGPDGWGVRAGVTLLFPK